MLERVLKMTPSRFLVTSKIASHLRAGAVEPDPGLHLCVGATVYQPGDAGQIISPLGASLSS